MVIYIEKRTAKQKQGTAYKKVTPTESVNIQVPNIFNAIRLF